MADITCQPQCLFLLSDPSGNLSDTLISYRLESVAVAHQRNSISRLRFSLRPLRAVTFVCGLWYLLTGLCRVEWGRVSPLRAGGSTAVLWLEVGVRTVL